jgi:exodeoxyribonuclease VII large subunit
LRGERQRVRGVAAALEGRTGRAVARRQQQLASVAGRLAHGGRQRLAATQRQTDYLAGRLVREASRAAIGRRRRLTAVTSALGGAARLPLRECAARLDLLAARTRGLDPRRLLERGFTLTLDERGRLLRLAAAIRPGQPLRTRFADGEIASVVTQADPPAARQPARRKARQGGKDGNKEGSGQQALF